MANTITDTYRDTLVGLGYSGTIADMQRSWLITTKGYAGPVASIPDMYRSLNPTGNFYALFSLF